jgi:putative aldouronate transport system permease protein
MAVKVDTKKLRQAPLGRRVFKQRYLLVMAIPGLIFLLIFNYYPIYFAQIAFENYLVTMGTNLTKAPFVGLTHFADFLRTPGLRDAIWNTLGISLYKLALGFPIPILFAVLLNEVQNLRYKKIVQSVTYLPHFLSWVIIGTLLNLWLSDTGPLTAVLYKLGLIPSQSNQLANPNAFWTIATVSEVWKEFGWNSILYLAAIAGIDQEMFEAARIDGAGKLRQIWNITLPSILPIISLTLILAISGLFSSNLNQILVIYNPVNAPKASTIDILQYKTAFAGGSYDLATAVGLMSSLVSAVLLLVANQVSKWANGNSLF